MDLLLEAKADVTVENQFGFTADVMALKAEKPELSKKLERIFDAQEEEK